MKIPLIKQISLYDYRYYIGYTLFALLLIGLLVININSVPNGLTDEEMRSATRSATANISTILFQNPIDAPYVLLQKASLHFFGLTTFAIRLPSIIIGLMTGMVLVFMLRQWFKDNVAALTSITVATAGPFMTFARSGTAFIMIAFWLSIILFAATRKLYGKKRTFKWKLLFFATAAASLYTPFMIYPLIAITIAGLAHPHIRHAIRRMSPVRLTIVSVVGLIILLPLVISSIKTPSLLFTLAGVPVSDISLQSIWTNIQLFFSVFFNFGDVRFRTFMLPLFNATTIILAGLGFLRTLKDRHTARSYMLLIWTFLILIGSAFYPRFIIVLYMPIVLFLAIGIDTLISEWYSLFPRNPYARIAALIPLTILLVSISTTNIVRYFYGYTYAVQPPLFHQELNSIRESLDLPALKDKQTTIVVSPAQQGFYDLLRREYKNVSVSSSKTISADNVIITKEGYKNLTDETKSRYSDPYRLTTTAHTSDALLLRVYVSR